MTWGSSGPWGAGSPWGTGSTLPPPSLVAIASEADTDAPTVNPAVVNELGGTICTLVGTNFSDPITIDILAGGPGAYSVVATGYVFDPEFDLKSNRVIFGAPALGIGTYSVRVTTEGGTSNVLQDVIAARTFADEYKTLSVRSKWAPKWSTGSRELSK